MSANKDRRRIVLFGGLPLIVVSVCFLVLIAVSRAVPVEPQGDVKAQTLSSRLRRVGDTPPNQKRFYTDLQFINERVGWLAIDDALWRTADGGQSWEKVWEDTDEHTLFDFTFSDSLTGWRYSLSEIYKTEDGGRTWKSFVLPFHGGEIVSVLFIDEKRGWLAGAVDQPGKSNARSRRSSPGAERTDVPAIYYTDDGGQTWRRQNLPGAVMTVAHDLRHSAGKVWVAAGVKLASLEGDRWKEVDYQKGDCPHDDMLTTVSVSSNYLDGVGPIDLHFSDPEHGWLAFPNGYLAKTVDGGNTWCDLFTFSESGTCFIKIHFNNAQHGWGLDNKGRLYESKDGGETWEMLNMNVKFQDMYFIDSANGWIVATEGLYRINS